MREKPLTKLNEKICRLLASPNFKAIRLYHFVVLIHKAGIKSEFH